ncbi:MAG: cofactor-independent phosphoglycerate mutase [Candidatus Omnitrophica bacterium]|nr:cofactor-independent phosphoglycerate mutase [Candidatus Omnitrophota bacterium]
MKYAFIVPDGLGDWPFQGLGNKTPLEVAKIPHLNGLSQKSILGTLKTVPDGMYPGSDVCGLSLLGYDPSQSYSGRAPLEAANLGLILKEGEMAYRTNLVTVEGDILADYSAGHVSTEEAVLLINAVEEKLGSDKITFYPGKMYRHIMIDRRGKRGKIEMDPPHDYMGEPYGKHWPRGEGADFFIDLMKRSRDFLENHPVNQKRAAEGKRKANMIWLWGGGTSPKIVPFEEKFKVQGGVISAVDLVNGIGRYIGLEIINVPGATGYFDTDYKAKGQYASKALDRLDLIYVHIEATDEAGHVGDAKEKVKAIEEIDRHIVGPVLTRLKKENEWRMCVVPDHYTPLEKKTHVADPVPFIFAGSDVREASSLSYTEKNASQTGIKIEKGYELMSKLIRGWKSSA